MVLKIIKFTGILLGALFLLLFAIAFSKVDKNSKNKLKDAWAGLFGKKKTDSTNPITGNSANKNTIVKPTFTPPTVNTTVSIEEQKFIYLNGFELASIIILKVIDPIRISGAADTEVYTRKQNTVLKTDQVGWTRNGEEVFKKYNTNGSFYYTIVQYVPIDPPQPLD